MDRDVRIQIEIERRRYLLGEKRKKKRPDAGLNRGPCG